jgi:hypothetical protein
MEHSQWKAVMPGDVLISCCMLFVYECGDWLILQGVTWYTHDMFKLIKLLLNWPLWVLISTEMNMFLKFINCMGIFIIRTWVILCNRVLIHCAFKELISDGCGGFTLEYPLVYWHLFLCPVPQPFAVVSWRHVYWVTVLCECSCKIMMLESRFCFLQLMI